MPTLKDIMRKGRYFREIADRYKKFLSPEYELGELDKANEVITEASQKLFLLIKEHEKK